MKTIVKVEEKAGGLEELHGEKVIFWCLNYHYHGTLSGINDTEVMLTDASVVYETGPLCGKLKDAQKLPGPVYVRLATVESYYKHEG